LKHFGAGFGPDEPAFVGIPIARSPGGLPVLTDALGYLEGRVTGQLDAGDHVVYAAEIVAAGAGPELGTVAPWVHLRKSGFGY
jgi:flavin reductase (DIM6/NTAB) family NADH-FMN oxidoreductase RutF